MLPKIPYSMDKNKSMTVPIGNLNLSSNFKPGDIAQSYGISARKYPRLTNRKTEEKVSGDVNGEILGMTVFNGEIVTMRQRIQTVSGDKRKRFVYLYIGDEMVYSFEGNAQSAPGGKGRLAVLNTKLVVYPEKIYIEKVNDEWVVGELEATLRLQKDKTEFASNRIQVFRQSKEYRYIFFDATQNSIVVPSQTKYNSLPTTNLFSFGDGTISQLKKYEVNGVSAEANYHTGTDGYLYVKIPRAADTTYLRDRIVFYNSSKGQWFHGNYVSLSYGTDSLYKLIKVRCDRSVDEGAAFLYVENINAELEPWNFSEFARVGEVCVIDAVFADEQSLNYGIIEEVSRNQLKIKNFMEGQYGPVWISSITYSESSSSNLDYISSGNEINVEGSGSNNDIFTVSKVSGDRIYLDVEETESITEEMVLSGKIHLSAGNALFMLFKVGDAVTVTGSSVTEEAVSNDTTFVIYKIKDNAIYASSDIFTPGKSSTPVKIERRVPDLDFICEKDNRLYGVNNSEKTLYVSALGDPTNMYAYEGVSTDSFAVAVGGEGVFTGCCKYAESVLFFKENKIYKLVGSYPAEFALYSYDVDGLQAGSDKSLVVINEVLYYKGKNGIFAYTGGVPTLLSENFGEHVFENAAAGTDGVNYYVSMVEGDEKYLISYNTRLGLWVLEGNDRYIEFVRTPSGLHYAIETVNDDEETIGEVYRMNVSDDASELEWMVQFVPFYETIEGKKIYSRLLMRVELPRGSYMIIEVRSDDGAWREAGKIVGANRGVIPIRLPIARCDKFELRLRGKGEFSILDILREYHVGSEV